MCSFLSPFHRQVDKPLPALTCQILKIKKESYVHPLQNVLDLRESFFNVMVYSIMEVVIACKVSHWSFSDLLICARGM